MMLNRLLLVDYGGVLGDHHQEPAESELAAALQVSVEQSRILLSENSEQGRAFRENKITETEFWNRVAELAGISVSERPSNSLLSGLWAETYKLNQRVLFLITAIRSQAPVGVLTNIDHARSSYLVDVVGILRLVDIYLPSYRFGATKYAREFWLAVDAEVRSRFGTVEVIYVDDRLQHIEACGCVGWRGVLYQSVEQLENQLHELFL